MDRNADPKEETQSLAIAVEVKSKPSLAVFRDYQPKFAEMRFSRFYFATLNLSLAADAASGSNLHFIFWDAEQLAQQSTRNGLAGWLLDRSS